MKYCESSSKDIDIRQIDALRESVGWQKRRSDEKWKEILSKSSFVYTVWDEEKLIGMARIFDDGVTYVFCDGVVHRDYQGKGIGRMMLEKLLEQVSDKDLANIYLFMDPDKMGILKPGYEKCGFESVDTAMRYRKRGKMI